MIKIFSTDFLGLASHIKSLQKHGVYIILNILSIK